MSLAERFAEISQERSREKRQELADAALEEIKGHKEEGILKECLKAIVRGELYVPLRTLYPVELYKEGFKMIPKNGCFWITWLA